MTGRSLAYPSLAPEATRRGVEAALRAAEAALEHALATPPGEAGLLLDRLDDVARILGEAHGRYAHPRQVDPDPARRAAAADAHASIGRWRHEAVQRPALAVLLAAATEAADDRGQPGIDEEAREALGRWTFEVRLAGASLAAGDRTELDALRARLLELAGPFHDRLGQARTVDLPRARLAGLPAEELDALPAGSDPGSVRVLLTEPMEIAILEHVHDRGVRELVSRGRTTRGGPENRAALEEAIAIRWRLAALLGERSWAALRLGQQMAATPEAVEAFLLEIVERVTPTAREELREAARELDGADGAGGDIGSAGPPDPTVRDWDWLYVDHRLREADGFDAEAFRDYLAFEPVLRGMFEVVGEVFGVRVAPAPLDGGWHEEVRAYDLVDDASGHVFASVLVDPFARDGKVNGAWADLLDPGTRDGSRRPVLVLCANSLPPAAGEARLTPYDVDTLFHEFGHVVQIALAFWKGRYGFFDHTWVLMDWIEAPSQFLGRWGTTAPVLARFARHRETGAPLPEALLEGYERSTRRNAGLRALRMVYLSWFDLRAHGPDRPDLDALNRESAALRLIPYAEGTYQPAAVAHLVGGYDAAFYGYLWAEVLADDLMTPFEAAGTYAPGVGRRYRELVLELPPLARPGPAVEAFLGRPPGSDAWFRRVSAGRPSGGPG